MSKRTELEEGYLSSNLASEPLVKKYLDRFAWRYEPLVYEDIYKLEALLDICYLDVKLVPLMVNLIIDKILTQPESKPYLEVVEGDVNKIKFPLYDYEYDERVRLALTYETTKKNHLKSLRMYRVDGYSFSKEFVDGNYAVHIKEDYEKEISHVVFGLISRMIEFYHLRIADYDSINEINIKRLHDKYNVELEGKYIGCLDMRTCKTLRDDVYLGKNKKIDRKVIFMMIIRTEIARARRVRERDYHFGKKNNKIFSRSRRGS